VGRRGDDIIVWVCREGMQVGLGKFCSIYVISPSATIFWNITIVNIDEYL
jgi:hypothetical protein